ncbi:hypothetical protein DY000_02034463 [Brassica cretica]|uniref:Purple acid phosphatase n=1 Tax=Brassica cretica TaxID=69181 RepID=A0ABQ7DKM6_BRACR|nr:hypothetical protein DY000_02034463 [Brassica cretica]
MSSRSDLTIMRVCFIIFLLGVLVELCDGGITSEYVRGSDLPDDMPLDSDVFKVPPGPNTPQQVHITQGNHEGNGVIISWVTPSAPGSNTVRYWSENGKSKKLAEATMNTYRFFNYTSGYIHHCLIDDLEFDMKYYYEIGSGKWQRRFWFFTPPKPGPDVPYTFGLIGDLGQTYDSNRTLSHYEMNPGKGQAVLFLGDLSYADRYPLHDNNRWDTWGRFVERSVAYQPWIWTAGNHEIDFVPDIGETEPFKPFTNRYHTPYKASGSISPLCMMQPQPSFSAFREASFGHGLLDIKNRTHAYFNWIRNQDGSSVEADSVWLLNRFWGSSKEDDGCCLPNTN